MVKVLLAAAAAATARGVVPEGEKVVTCEAGRVALDGVGLAAVVMSTSSEADDSWALTSSSCSALLRSRTWVVACMVVDACMVVVTVVEVGVGEAVMELGCLAVSCLVEEGCSVASESVWA